MIGRIPIVDVAPLVGGGAVGGGVVGCGRWPAKAVVGETVPVGATVFREGHDAVNANVVLHDPRGAAVAWVPMRLVAPGTDRWEAEVVPTETGLWTFQVEAWGDPMATWRHDAEIKVSVGQDVELMLEEGARLFERAAAVVPDDYRDSCLGAAHTLRDTSLDAGKRLGAGFDPTLLAVLETSPLREFVTVSERFPLAVDRERALFGSWYEFFPRSEGADVYSDPPRSGTFRSAMERLPAIADLGFDVVYLPPIHPIGWSFRKGRNNSLTPEPGDPGSPWAIGSDEGGHDAIHPDLGTLEDFDAFVWRVRELGMEVALDFALQASSDHPWVREHPEWFTIRADGSIAYAENPPKKYQDIYPVNFDRDPEGLYAEVLRVLRHWMAHGVRIFRVDNPHTKPVQLWERLLAEVRETDPDVLFLAEAFTRPPMMHTLAKVGFHQSYTYFTWRNEKWELEEYLRELSGPATDYMRPNFFVNTPDILHAYLQYGGPPAFKIRAVLAAMLSPSWGVYSGYELYEHVPVRPGSEEYCDSEKYEYRPRDWSRPDSLAPYLRTLNELRRRHPALQRLRNLRFHAADQPHVMAFSKRLPGPSHDGLGDVVLVVVNLDPHGTREATVSLTLPDVGVEWDDRIEVHDEVSEQTFVWGRHNYVRLDPFVEPAHIFTVRRMHR